MTSFSSPPEVLTRLDRIEKHLAELAASIKTTIPKKEFYRPSEVCQILGISRSKFEEFKRSGEFSFRKIGYSVYVPAADLEKFLPLSKK